jgi:hypothetical protein
MVIAVLIGAMAVNQGEAAMTYEAAMIYKERRHRAG